MLYTPTGLGPQTGSLVVTSNDKVHPSKTVNLQDTGMPGVPSLSIPALLEPPNPLLMSFGTVGIGVTPKTLVLKIHNVGLGALGGGVGALGAPLRRHPGGWSVRADRTGRGAKRDGAVYADRRWPCINDADDHDQRSEPVEGDAARADNRHGSAGTSRDQRPGWDDVHVAQRDARVWGGLAHRDT